MILSGVLLTIVIAAALTYASVSLMHTSSTRSKKGPALLAEAASVSQIESPVFVGTDHPVPVNSPQQLADISKYKAPNPPATPYKAPNPPSTSTPQPSAVAETDS